MDELLKTLGGTVATFVAGALVVWLKDYRDKAAVHAKLRALEAEAQAAALRYETLRIGFQTELLAAERQRLTGRTTPVGARVESIRRHVSRTFPEIDPRQFDQYIESEAPVVQNIFKVAQSMPPPSGAGFALPDIPRDPPTIDFSTKPDKKDEV